MGIRFRRAQPNFEHNLADANLAQPLGPWLDAWFFPLVLVGFLTTDPLGGSSESHQYWWETPDPTSIGGNPPITEVLVGIRPRPAQPNLEHNLADANLAQPSLTQKGRRRPPWIPQPYCEVPQVQ